MLLYILFLVVLIKIFINLFTKINIEKFITKQDITNKFYISDFPDNTDSTTYNITGYSNQHNIDSEMSNELVEQSTQNITGFDDYVKKTNFYDDHINKINDYIEDIHNTEYSSKYKQHMYNTANKNKETQGSPQKTFDMIVDNHRDMYKKLIEYQTDDIENKITEYENAKNYI